MGTIADDQRAPPRAGHASTFSRVLVGVVCALVGASGIVDLVVVGSRGVHGLKALGSVSERVAHQAECSVLVVREAPWQQAGQAGGRRRVTSTILAADTVDVILRDGSTLRLRAPAESDRDSLVRFFEQLSERSLYLRFHGSPDDRRAPRRAPSSIPTGSTAARSWVQWSSQVKNESSRSPTTFACATR